jgi:hypothetical protein
MPFTGSVELDGQDIYAPGVDAVSPPRRRLARAQPGTYREAGEHVLFHELPQLRTRDVADVLTRATARMRKDLRRRGLLEDDEVDAEVEGLEALAASAASGQAPPAGPEWRRGSLPLPRTQAPLSYDKPLCAALDRFTLHAATRRRARRQRPRGPP